MRAAVLLTFAALTLPSLASAQDSNAAKDPANFTWVEEGVLAVGGGGLTEADVDTLHALGFRAIVDLRAEHDDPESYITAKGMEFLDMPIDSAADINETQLASFTAWAREQQDAGRPIYIHCTNGWHRAAAFAVAWDLWDDRRDGEDPEPDDGYDAEAREQMQKRPGTVMRAVSALLDYYATLSHEPQVAVTLSSPLSHPGLNATMVVRVDVVAGGRPAENAPVKVWSEESKIRLEGLTDAGGSYSFHYQAPASAFMDHVYARASVEGYIDGADNVEFIFAQPAKSRGALDVDAEITSEGIFVKATNNGKPIATRFVLSAPGWTAFEASAIGTALITGAPAGATIDVRVVSWGSEGGSARIDTPAPPVVEPPVVAPPVIEPPPQELPPQPEPPMQEQPPLVAPPANDPTPTPSDEPVARWEIARGLAERYGIAALAIVAVIAVAYVAARTRSGVGNT